jgi:1,4-dihydroxy-2-naphthoate octaprenyltransferase
VKKITLITWFEMTRPGFLIITFVACLIGISNASLHQAHIQTSTAGATFILALLAHAFANVLNDYQDAINGADASNHNAIRPFTGGARFIQNQVASLAQTRILYLSLIFLVIFCGLLLAWFSTLELLLLGIVGIFLGWAYSSPPIALMSIGLGELAVMLCWTMIVVGADLVQRKTFNTDMLWPAISFGLLIGNILLINGFPDALSDAQVGKNTLVVKIGNKSAAKLYVIVANTGHAFLLLTVLIGLQPNSASWGLMSWPLSLWATYLLWKNALKVHNLRLAIQLTIAAACLHGLALSAGLSISRLFL